jgi:hypothetical protein
MTLQSRAVPGVRAESFNEVKSSFNRPIVAPAECALGDVSILATLELINSRAMYGTIQGKTLDKAQVLRKESADTSNLFRIDQG